MKYSLLYFIFFVLSVDVNAADDKSKEMELPETFISGNASVGAQLETHVLHVMALMEIVLAPIGQSFQDRIKDIFMSNLNTLETEQE